MGPPQLSSVSSDESSNLNQTFPQAAVTRTLENTLPDISIQAGNNKGNLNPFSLTVLLPVRITGTKYGCGTGGCGACTVMVSRYDPKNKKVQYPLHWPVRALGVSGKDEEPSM